MKTAPVKTDRDNGSFSIIGLTECQDLFQKGNLEKIHMFAHKVFILIPTFIGDSTNFWPISLGNET